MMVGSVVDDWLPSAMDDGILHWPNPSLNLCSFLDFDSTGRPDSRYSQVVCHCQQSVPDKFHFALHLVRLYSTAR